MLDSTCSAIVHTDDAVRQRFDPRTTFLSTSVMRALVDEIDYAVFLCNADLTLRFANRSARQRLGSECLGSMQDGRLHCPGSRLASAVRNACEKGRRELITLRGEVCERVAAVIPVVDEEAGGVCAVVILGRRAEDNALAIECLARDYGLSLAEREVLADLRRGQRASALARDRGVSETTVRTQIAALRDKLGRSSVTGLLVRLAELPPMVAALCSVPCREEAFAWERAVPMAREHPALCAKANVPTNMPVNAIDIPSTR